MGGQLGLREVQPDQSALLHWRNITIDTGKWLPAAVRDPCGAVAVKKLGGYLSRVNAKDAGRSRVEEYSTYTHYERGFIYCMLWCKVIVSNK